MQRSTTTTIAKAELEKLKKEDIEVKVVAVGGADVEMLKAFSTSNYVYNATSTDLQGIIKDVSTNSDELIVKLNNYLEYEQLSEEDNVIIYSTFMNIDSVSDFSLIPNLSSNDFYEEFKLQNEKRGVKINFSGASVYCTVIGGAGSKELSNLKGFWKRFIKDNEGNLKYFNTTALDLEDIK